MLRIRLFRIGKKHQPSFKIVVVDKKRAPKGGRFIAELGFINPLTKEKSLDKEKAKHWISKGAQPSDTVHNLLVKEGVIEGKKINVHKKPKKKPADAKGSGEAKEEVKTEEPKEAKSKEKPAEETKPEEKKEEGKSEEVKKEEVKPEKKPEEKKEEPKKETE